MLRYLSRVGLLRYNCHSGYLSSVVQESEMTNVLTPAAAWGMFVNKILAFHKERI